MGSRRWRPGCSDPSQQLSTGAARLFRLLALHPGPDISAPAAASLAGSPVGQVRAQLAELTRENLVTEHLPGRYAARRSSRADLGQIGVV